MEMGCGGRLSGPLPSRIKKFSIHPSLWRRGFDVGSSRRRVLSEGVIRRSKRPTLSSSQGCAAVVDFLESRQGGNLNRILENQGAGGGRISDKGTCTGATPEMVQNKGKEGCGEPESGTHQSNDVDEEAHLTPEKSSPVAEDVITCSPLAMVRPEEWGRLELTMGDEGEKDISLWVKRRAKGFGRFLGVSCTGFEDRIVDLLLEIERDRSTSKKGGMRVEVKAGRGTIGS